MLKDVLTIDIYAKYALMFSVKSGRNSSKNLYPVSVISEPDHLFENPVPVKPEREWGNIYPIPVLRTGFDDLKIWYLITKRNCGLDPNSSSG